MPLRRADRLFDILRVLRAASRPVTAASLADELEVTVRTVYRDIAALHPDRGRARDWLCIAARLRAAAADVHRGRGRSDCRGRAYARAHRRSGIAEGGRERAVKGHPGRARPIGEYLRATPVYVSKSGAPVPARRTCRP